MSKQETYLKIVGDFRSEILSDSVFSSRNMKDRQAIADAVLEAALRRCWISSQANLLHPHVLSTRGWKPSKDQLISELRTSRFLAIELLEHVDGPIVELVQQLLKDEIVDDVKRKEKQRRHVPERDTSKRPDYLPELTRQPFTIKR